MYSLFVGLCVYCIFNKKTLEGTEKWRRSHKGGEGGSYFLLTRESMISNKRPIV